MPSALERRLSQYMTLTYNERDALDWLERRERQVEAGDVVMEQDRAAGALYVVGDGWLHSSVTLADGERQILRFYFVGDLTSACNIAWEYSASTVTAVSDCTLFEIPKAALGRLFADHPRLGAMLYGLAAAEQVALSDRLSQIGRMDGMTRIATLLLDLHSRLRVVDKLEGSTFTLPLTQQDLGDAVGLTKAHVNRSLRVMEELKLIERDGRLLKINDIESLSRRVGFKDRHGHVAADWLPPPK